MRYQFLALTGPREGVHNATPVQAVEVLAIMNDNFDKNLFFCADTSRGSREYQSKYGSTWHCSVMSRSSRSAGRSCVN